MDSFKDLQAILNKHKQKKKKYFKDFGRKTKELNALIQKNFRSLLKTRKRGKQKKSSSTFKKCRSPTMKVKRASPAWQKVWKVEKSNPLVLNEI